MTKAAGLYAPDGSTYITLTDGAGNVVTQTSGTVTSVSVTTANGVSGVVATATSTPAITITLGAITPTSVNGVTITRGQILGTNTNDAAAAGNIGEIISSEILTGAAVSLTANTPKDITTILLTAGDWEVSGVIIFNPAGTTLTSYTLAWSTGVANTLPTLPNQGGVTGGGSAGAGLATGISAGRKRFSVATTQTVSLGAMAGFTVSTMTAYGYIQAERVR